MDQLLDTSRRLIHVRNVKTRTPTIDTKYRGPTQIWAGRRTESEALQLEFVKLAVKRATAHTDLLRCLGPISIALLEGVNDQLLLGLLHCQPAGGKGLLRFLGALLYSRGTHTRVKVSPGEIIPAAHDHRVLHGRVQ